MLLHKELANSMPTSKTDKCGIVSSNPPNNIFPKGAKPGIQCRKTANCYNITHTVIYAVIHVEDVVIGCTDDPKAANAKHGIPNSRQIVIPNAAIPVSIQCDDKFEALTTPIPHLYQNGDRLENITVQAVYKCRRSEQNS